MAAAAGSDRFGAMILAAALLAFLGVLAPIPPSPARAVQLRVEHLANPLGIDAHRPRFSWRMSDSRHGARQSAYRLLVATSASRLVPGRADVWDSGIVAADSSVDVTYTGPALAPRHR
jgi:alpha-L-rhamnosidase